MGAVIDELSLQKALLEARLRVPAWRVLAVLCGVAFTSNVIISLIAPILPQHYERIGVSQIWCGIMFSAFPVAMLACSPLVVAAMARFGRVPVLFFGLLLQGITSITFGYADQLTGGVGADPAAALVVYTLSRLACGAGGACANNAIFAIAADRFPDSLSKVMGLNEVVIGAGFSLGPPIGTALVLTYGFDVCFLIAASSIFAFAPFTLLLRQPMLEEEDESVGPIQSGKLSEVLTPGLLVAAGCLLLGTGVFGVVEPILSLYLQDEVGVHPVSIGVIFGILSLAYSAAGPLMGAVADHVGALKVCSLGGVVAGLVMVLLMGPEAGLLPKGSSARITYEIAALVLLGFAQAATLIPSLPAMKAGVPSGLPNSTDRIVACFNMFMQLGLAVGPMIGTAVNSILGFELSVALYGAAVATYGVGAAAFAMRSERHADVSMQSPSLLLTGISISPFSTPKVSRALSM